MIIKSLLDNDLYTFTVMQLVFHQFKDMDVNYKFKIRNKGVDLRSIKPQVQAQVRMLHGRKFSANELWYLNSLGYFKLDFIDYLRNYTLDTTGITISEDMEISIKGRWLETIMFEVPLLAIINELYFDQFNHDWERHGHLILNGKITQLNDNPDFKFNDFGTRRRRSADWQRLVLTRLLNETNSLAGTSNVYLAMELGIPVVGTMSHQYLMAFQALCHPLQAQKLALGAWITEYGTKLGIVLTDTIGIDAFLNDFDDVFASIYSGVRHDSGDPYDWAEQVITHYRALGIDPLTKTLVFSDGLTINKAINLFNKFKSQVKLVSPGIGTSLTNDVGYVPLQIVIKPVTFNGIPVAKLSDSPGKTMCDSDAYVTYLRELFNCAS